ncbi:MAG: ATP-binding protein [Phycisphaerae bacterium]
MSHAERVKLSISSNAKCLPVVRSAAERMAKVEGFDDQQAQEVGLAIDEALANVIKHGYRGDSDEPIVILMSVARSEDGRRGLSVIVRDRGRQVDPSTIRSRDLDDVRPGGLGVHIIQTVMDEVEYSCPPEGGMQLRMVKYVGGGGGSGGVRSVPGPVAKDNDDE